MKRETSRGFTLIELLVVIAIIGILSSVVLASLNSARAKSRYASAVSQMRQIDLAAEHYYSVNGSYPGDASPGSMPSGLSTYMASWPTPPCSGYTYDWNYFSSGANVHVMLRSSTTDLYSYCVYSSTGTCTGTNITTISPKELVCQ